MKKKFILFSFVILSVFFISGCANKVDQNINEDKNQVTPIQEDKNKKNAEILNDIQNSEVNNVGGQKDEYGCLGSAGYSWDENIMACTRNWEITEDLKKAAKMAVEISSYHSLTVIEVLKMDCEGCFAIKLQRNNIEDPKNEYYTVRLENWKFVN